MRFRSLFFFVTLFVILCPVKPLRAEDQRLTNRTDDYRTSSGARSVAVDESGGVHVVWSSFAENQGGVYYRFSPDRGVSWGPERAITPDKGRHEQPSVAVSSSQVYIAWQTTLPDQGASVFFIRSKNRGTTWDAPVAIASSTSERPSIAASGASVHLVYADTRGGDPEVYYRRSSDSGVSWEPERSISESPNPSWMASIAASEKHLAIAWVDARDGNEETYIRISPDGGNTWEKETRITKNRLRSWEPSVAVSGQTIHLTWTDQQDNGVDLKDAERQLDDIMGLIGLSYVSESLKKTRAGVFESEALQTRVTRKLDQVRTAAPIWTARGGDLQSLGAMIREVESIMETANRDWEVYWRRSEDGGKTWKKEQRISKSPGKSFSPGVVASGPTVYLVWSDDRAGNPGLYQVFSSDGGRSWSEEKRLTPETRIAERPSIGVGTGGAHLVWTERQNNGAVVYYRPLILP